MFSPRRQAALSVLWVFGSLSLSVCGEKVSESSPGLIYEFREALANLAEGGRTYLDKLAGEQTVLSVQKAFSQVLNVVAENLAAGLNVVVQYFSHFQKTSGINVISSKPKVTPGGLIYVARWVLIALISYWLFSLALRLVSSTLKRALWLLKVAVALACFGLILSDRSVDTETLAIRMAVLVFFCVVLGVGTSRGSNLDDKTGHLEKQINVLELRLREMERLKRTE